MAICNLAEYRNHRKTFANFVLPNKAGYPGFASIVNSEHVLIAGTTGSGKSVLLNDIIYHILCNKKPIKSADGCAFVLIDPKRVELSLYKHVPHCLGYESEVPEIIRLLDGCIKRMEDRYKYMEENGLKVYPYESIFIIIDELADLMVVSQREIMPRLQRLAQLGRAAKMFLICATQAPNRTVIPANLTLNFGRRIALHCISAIESKQVINAKGAELLPRYGECLEMSADGIKHKLIPMTPETELQEVIHFWERQKTVSC